MKWRKWNNAIHRDLGYLCFGLTIIYALSGLAVNHIHDWNPTYSLEKSVVPVDLSQVDMSNNQAITDTVLKQLNNTEGLKNIYRQSNTVLKIFVVNNNITVDLQKQTAFQEKSTKRPVLYQVNFLHLNHAKKWWTWFADLYALSLALLAITGLLVLRGKRGLSGRGKWLVVIGLVIPIFFLLFYS